MKKKKLASLLMSLLLAAGLSVPAFAQDFGDSAESGNPEDITQLVFIVHPSFFFIFFLPICGSLYVFSLSSERIPQNPHRRKRVPADFMVFSLFALIRKTGLSSQSARLISDRNSTNWNIMLPPKNKTA